LLLHDNTQYKVTFIIIIHYSLGEFGAGFGNGEGVGAVGGGT